MYRCSAHTWYKDGGLATPRRTMPAQLGIDGFGPIGILMSRSAYAKPDAEWSLSTNLSCLSITISTYTSTTASTDGPMATSQCLKENSLSSSENVPPHWTRARGLTSMYQFVRSKVFLVGFSTSSRIQNYESLKLMNTHRVPFSWTCLES